MLQMLMRQDVAQCLGRLYQSGIVPNVEQLAALHAVHPVRAARSNGQTSAQAPKNYQVVANVAQITISGVLTEQPDFWAWLMGLDQTCYCDIRDGLALAASDAQVTKVRFAVKSPGGYVDGLFDTLAAIEAFAKPIDVVADEACSAAYGIAAMAGKIHARRKTSVFGSVGVVRTYYVDPQTVEITNTDAPNKRPDVTSEEGKAVVRSELDAIFELFADGIVRGRSNATGKAFTIGQVKSDFGRGGEVLAEEAADKGMIDRVTPNPKRGSGKADSDDADDPIEPAVTSLQATPPAQSASATQPPRVSGPNRKPTMDEAAFKAQHPELHELVMGKGRTEGQTTERKRVSAHMKMAKIHGASAEVVAKFVESGASVQDDDVFVEYQAAGANRRDIANRQEDEVEVEAATKGTTKGSAEAPTKDLGDNVAARMAARRGKKVA